MTTEAINALTEQTTGLLEQCTLLKIGVSKQIADAVSVSTNAAVVPLVTMATNLIDTQTMLVTYISR